MRQANHFDRKEIIKMMVEFRDSADFVEISASTNTTNVNRLLDQIFAGAGAIFYEPDKGLLASLIAPSIWDHEVLILHEIAWYVRPQYRGSRIGFKLFKAYLEYGKELKNSGRIQYFTMTKLDSSPDFKYARYGFRVKDINWIQ